MLSIMKHTNNERKKPSTRQQILTYIQKSDMVSPVDINTQFDINRQMIHRHLKILLEAGEIRKIGSAPKVFYTAINNNAVIPSYKINAETKGVINKISSLLSLQVQSYLALMVLKSGVKNATSISVKKLKNLKKLLKNTKREKLMICWMLVIK
ncbi:hypothetical protein CRYPA_1014 [uncultured Candidatus Thioglobus sp.]|nr:hypothetical protein CRYPA_1014 [uncultured Candidatus Thioglobus sp.]